jgi:hypothetical protein
MTDPHIAIQIERISRITANLPRDALEKFLFKLVGNFLEREFVYSQLLETLKDNVPEKDIINQ